MDILLINPPTIEAYGKYKAAAKVGAQPQMPLGLCYLGTVLDKANHKVKIIDCDIEEFDIPKLMEEIKIRNPDVVGVTASTPIFESAKKIIKQVKELNKNITTILGGFHITALPVQSMEDSQADIGIFGEGETTIVELVDYLEKKKDLKEVKGILYRKEGQIIKNPSRELIKDLDSIPFPARRLLNYKKYVWSVPKKGLEPVTSITTQRGCPFNCIFCGVKTIFPGVRYRSIENILEEIEYIVNELGINHIMIQDDTLTLSKDKMIKFCNEVKKRNLKFTWEGYTRANLITKELLELMKESGLIRLSFGVESGNQKVLDACKKEVKLEDYQNAYEWCHELNIETRCSLMLGLPFETKETIKETIKFANSLKCYQAYINITTPYPGTDLLDLAKQGYGGIRLLTEDWKDYRRYGNAVMEVNDLNKDDLIKLQKKAYKKFYLRPKIVMYNLKRAGVKAAFVNAWAFFRSVIA